jgi:hypothetical protein
MRKDRKTGGTTDMTNRIGAFRNFINGLIKCRGCKVKGYVLTVFDAIAFGASAVYIKNLKAPLLHRNRKLSARP